VIELVSSLNDNFLKEGSNPRFRASLCDVMDNSSVLKDCQLSFFVERIFVKIKENSFYRSNAYQNKMVRGVTIEFINNKHGSGIQG
jgi:hypothetical protein